jgi:hypothetical protein
VQATSKVIQNHENERVRSIGQGDFENITGLNLAVVKLTTVQVTKLPFSCKISRIGMNCVAEPVLAENLYMCAIRKTDER